MTMAGLTWPLSGRCGPLSGSLLSEWVGRFGDQPEEVLEAFISRVKEVNYQGAYYMRTVQFERKKAMAARLAEIAGCSAEELIITRNTTESLDMVISGYPWQTGDEAIMAQQDYGAMLNMFRQVGRRYGVVPKLVSVPNHPASDEELVSLYADAITPRTRLLMVSHLINITGQIIPVRMICDMAHARGVEVMVDGAHRLLKHYKIYTVAIDAPEAGVQGCRITPNLFTLPEELDVLVGALKEMGATLPTA